MITKPSAVETRRRLRAGTILAHLQDRGKVELADLKEYGSERTIRSDFAAIHQLRTCRVRGGIKLAGSNSYAGQARLDHLEAKLDVASKAAEQFPPSCSVAASPGSTVALTFAALVEKGTACAVITNSLSLPEYATGEGSPLHLVPGGYNESIHGVVGEDAAQGFRRNCRIGLLGVSGLDFVDSGECVLYVRHGAEVPVLSEMLNHVTEKIVIVANIQKLGHSDAWPIGTLAGLITSPSPHGFKRQVVLVTNNVEEWREDLGEHYPVAADRFRRLQKAAFRNKENIKLVVAARGEKWKGDESER